MDEYPHKPFVRQLTLDLDGIEEDTGIAMTTCATCEQRIPRRDAIRTKLEDFCSVTCQADYERY